MKIYQRLLKILEKILPPMYGIFEKGSFPVKRKLNLSQAKSLILEAGGKNRWKEETGFTFSFLKETFLEQNKDKDLILCDYGVGIGRLALPILRDYPKAKIIGVDESKSILELAKQWLPQVFFDEKRIELLKPEQFFEKYQIGAHSARALSPFRPSFRSKEGGRIVPGRLSESPSLSRRLKEGRNSDLSEFRYDQEKTFDLIIAVYVFQHIFLKELRKTLPALHRLLKDDGKLFVVNTFQNDDHLNRMVVIKDLLKPYFEKEIEISPYERQEEYINWMGKTGAGYGNWQEMEKARPRCQKFMGIYKKLNN